MCSDRRQSNCNCAMPLPGILLLCTALWDKSVHYQHNQKSSNGFSLHPDFFLVLIFVNLSNVHVQNLELVWKEPLCVQKM